MFQALFNSLSGLLSFSRGLNTISNNVSNMNTPGFRGSDSFFSNVSGGHGTSISSEGLRTYKGDIRQSNNPTDLAIDGDGYFVLTNEEGDLFYSRAGQFSFNEDDVLADVVSGYRVMAYDSSGALSVIDRTAYRSLPAAATTGVHIRGNVIPVFAGDPETTTVARSITVYDAAGGAHVLEATFVSESAVGLGSYRVTFEDASGATVGSGEVRFDGTGSPLAGFNTMVVSLSVAGGTQTINVSFGTPGLRDGMTSNSGLGANLTGDADDGHGVLGLKDIAINEKGVFEFVYSDTEKRTGSQIALANLSNEVAMSLSGDRLISGTSIVSPQIGRAGEGDVGKVKGRSLEMSNVDLTREFADMIVIQRGYQANSRVMTVSNQMLEQLYSSTGGG